MRRLVLLAVGGIAVVLIGALAVILLVSPDDRAPETAAPPPPAQLRQPIGTPAPSSDVPPEFRGPPPTPAPVGEVQVPVPPPAPNTWEAVPRLPRLAALKGTGPAIIRHLNEIRPQIEVCFSEQSQSRYGGTPVTKVGDYQVLEDAGVTVLVLNLEAQPGSIRIVDAPVETQGNLSEGLVACVQEKLRNLQIPAPAAKSGERYRVRYPLIP